MNPRISIEAELLRILHSPARQYEVVEAEREGRTLFQVTRADRYALLRILNPRLEESIQARIRAARRAKEHWQDYHAAKPVENSPSTSSTSTSGTDSDSKSEYLPSAKISEAFREIKNPTHVESEEPVESWVSMEELELQV